MSTGTSFKPNELPWGLEITQFVYFILSLLGSFAFIVRIFSSGQITLKFIWTGMMTAVYWLFFYGTWNFKNWVVIPISVFSALSLIPNLINVITTEPETTEELFQKAVSLIMAIFFLLQLYIFTRPKTKDFFKEKGTTLVS